MLGFLAPLFFAISVSWIWIGGFSAQTAMAYWAGPQEQAGRSIQEMDDMELMARVEQLLLELQATEIKQRDEAEQQLLKLGPGILGLLDPESDVPTDVRERVVRVREALEQQVAEQMSRPSHVTLKGEFTINQVLQAIGQQTQNKLVLAEFAAATAADKKFNADWDGVQFWEVIRELREHGLAVNAFSSADGSLVLVPEAKFVVGQPEAVDKPELPGDRKSVFEVSVVRVEASRNLENPSLNHCRLQLRVRWEPRIRPISIDLPLSELKIVDEFDKAVAIENPEAVLSGIVQPQIPELEFTIPLPLVDRQVESLKSLTAKVNAVLPGRTEKFQFKDVSQLEPGTSQSRFGATVTYDGTFKNDDVYGTTIKLEFDDTSGAFESHQGWVYDNPCYLLDKDGNKIQSVGMETISQSETAVTCQYFFVSNPMECTVVYETPSVIVHLPIEIQIQKIPLP